jgi:hypothetical protein
MRAMRIGGLVERLAIRQKMRVRISQLLLIATGKSTLRMEFSPFLFLFLRYGHVSILIQAVYREL